MALAVIDLSAMGGDQPVLVDELQKLGQLPLVFVDDVIEASALACYPQLSWRRQWSLQGCRPLGPIIYLHGNGCDGWIGGAAVHAVLVACEGASQCSLVGERAI